MHSGMFRCKNIELHHDLANFWPKRLNLLQKMSKIGQIMLSRDVFTMKKQEKHSTVHRIERLLKS